MEQKIISVKDYGVRPGADDSCLPLWQCLKSIHRKGVTLEFSKGDYHFYPELAQERLLCISNNSHGLKRVGLPLEHAEGLTVEGNGSRFIFHGKMVAILVSNCQDVTLKNFSIDWADPFVGQGKVLGATAHHIDLEMCPDGAPWALKEGTMFFHGHGWENPFDYFLEFDGVTGRVAWKAPDNGDSGWHLRRQVEALGEGRVRIHCEKPMKSVPHVGNHLLMKGGNRHSPAAFLETSQNTRFESVSVYHAGGMAFIGQKCEGVRLAHCAVTSTPGTKRLFSAMADATHFVYCRGAMSLEDCLFEGQLDDPGNFHGIYGRIERILAERDLLVRLVHHEQVGFPLVAPGETLRFIDPQTLLPAGTTKVQSVDFINVDHMRVRVAETPPRLVAGFTVENLDWVPDVTICRCTAKRNRARGFLVSTGGKVRIEGNTFSTPGAALKISGDANHWFESGAVNDVVISKNRFESCNDGVWGKAAIDIDPEIAQLGKGPYHRNITIENNTFEAFHPCLVYARSVEGLTFINNTVLPFSSKGAPTVPYRLDLFHCQKIVVSNPGVAGEVYRDGEKSGDLEKGLNASI